MDEKQKQDDAEFVIKSFTSYKGIGEIFYRLSCGAKEFTDDQATRIKVIDLHFLFGLVCALGLMKKTLELPYPEDTENREIFHMANVKDQGEKYADWCDEFLKATYDINPEVSIKISKVAAGAFMKMEEIKEKDIDEEAKKNESQTTLQTLGNLYKDDDINFNY